MALRACEWQPDLRKPRRAVGGTANGGGGRPRRDAACRETSVFLSLFIINDRFISPRQARDNQQENLKTRGCFPQDRDVGTLSVFLNGQKLGVMARGRGLQAFIH